MREYSIGTLSGLESILPADLATRLSAYRPPVAVDRNASVYLQGDAADAVFFILRGRVKSVLVTEAGQPSILRIHLPFSLLGLTALASNPVREASAVALDALALVPIPRAAFIGLLAAEPGLSASVIRLLVDRMSDFHHRVGDLLAQPVEQRLARALLALSTPDPSGGTGNETDIPLSHEELAQLIGTRRPTVSGALARLARQGAVRKMGRRLTVSDRPLLARLAGETLSG